MIMAKRRRTWNKSAYQKLIKEGRGQGAGADYVPWIKIQDFPSNGMVSRIKGAKTGRVHHLLSNHEMRLFYLLDWSDDVIDIREQYPLLDLQLAIETAEMAQIRYPCDPVSGFPYVMTSDFYVETVSGVMIISVKSVSDLENPRTREKLEVERRYWNNQGFRWTIATENEINPVKAKNIEWLSQASDLSVFALSEEVKLACVSYFLANYEQNQCLLGKIIADVEYRFELPVGMGVNIFKHLAYWKRINVNVNEEIDFRGFVNTPAKIIA
jgi:hypothetical protein